MPQALCPVLIGRSRDLEQIEQLLAKARRGSGGLVFVLGEAGIGKSRLLRETQSRAQDLGMGVLAGRAVRGGARLPFRPLVEAVASWTRAQGLPDDESLTPYRPALGWLVPEWTPHGTAQVSPVLMLEAVVRLLSAMAGRTGLVLLLDDLHWADADTLDVVEYLVDNLGSEPVLCVCALRSDEPGPAAPLADRLVARRAAPALRLGRLSDRDVDEMIRATTPEASEGEQLAAVRRRAEGVPFLVEEMLAACLTSGSPVLPASYGDLIRGRMQRMDPDAHRVIQAAAAIGRDFDWPALAAITQLEQHEVLEALKTAIEAQLVGAADAPDDVRFTFRHALIQEAILQELLPAEQTELFLHAAAALEEAFPGLPGDLCQVAADLRERAGDYHHAGSLLVEIGRRALAATALGTAEAALRRALELAQPDRWRLMGVHRLLLQVLVQSGKTEGLREIGEAALAFFQDKTFAATPGQFSDLHLQIARGLAALPDGEVVDLHLERAMGWAQRDGDPGQLARIDAFRAHVLLDRGEVDDAAELAARTQRFVLADGPDDVVCEVARVEARVRWLAGATEEAVRILERARVHADRADLALERARIHLALAEIDRCTTADLANAEKARRLSEPAGAVALGAAADLELARLHIERFELADAARLADHASVVCRRSGLPLAAWAAATRAQILALSGDPRATRAAEDATPSPEAGVVALGDATAVLHLLREERAQALAALDAAADASRTVRLVGPWPFHGTWALLRVVAGAGIEEVDDQLSRPGVLAHAANRGLRAAARAVHEGRRGHATRALEQVTAATRLLGPFVWRRSLALRLLAEAAVADGWGEPASWAGESLRFFDRAGHQRAGAACRGLLRRAGVRVPRKGRGDSAVPAELAALGVTSREMDVLRLVAEGLSNADIAERLFVSVRTVETHASRLLRKTGVEGRPQLVAFANRVAAEPTPAPSGADPRY